MAITEKFPEKELEIDLLIGDLNEILRVLQEEDTGSIENALEHFSSHFRDLQKRFDSPEIQQISKNFKTLRRAISRGDGSHIKSAFLKTQHALHLLQG